MNASQSEYNNNPKPLPVWTRFMPWIILIATSVACFFVIQKGCEVNSAEEYHTNGHAESDELVYPSQGIHDLEVALENSNTITNEFVLDGISFIQGSGLLDVTSMSALEQLLELMMEFQTVHIRLEGYCVRQQDSKANLKVSHLRAVAVANYLKGKGIDAGRLRTVGRGDSRRRLPAASTQSAAQNELIGLFVEHR